jgi:twitching motility protein PilT
MSPDKTIDIPELMAQGYTQYGMQTFDQSIMKLYKSGMISFEEAMSQASNPDDFDLRLRGITGAADRWEDNPDTVTSKPKRDIPKGFQKL